MAFEHRVLLCLACVAGWLVASACGGTSTTCLRHSDCVSGESCNAGMCSVGSSKPAAEGSGDAGQFDGDTVKDSSPE